MNQWKKCLQCFIPVSKKKDKNYVIPHSEGDTDTAEVDTVASSDVFDQSLAVRPPSVSVSSGESSPSGTPPPPLSADASENYILLEDCISNPRSQPKPRQLPKMLAERDIHLLDAVPPSPCSLADNFGALSGMPEVYNPMMCRATPRTVARGQSSLPLGVGVRGSCESPRKTYRNGTRIDERGWTLDGATIPDRIHTYLLKADLRNNNMCAANIEQGINPDARSRRGLSSVSSESSVLSDQKPFSTSTAVYSHHSQMSSDRPDCLNYCNIPNTSCSSGGRPPVAQRFPSAAIECSNSMRQNRLPVAMTPGDANERMHLDSAVELPCHSQDSFKILHMTPPAPAHNSKFRAHKYVNGAEGPGGFRGLDGGTVEDSCHLSPCFSEDALPMICATESESYYNLVPPINQLSKTENVMLPPPPPIPLSSYVPSGSYKKPFIHARQRPRHDSPVRVTPPDDVVLPVRKWSRPTDESSSSNDEEDDESSSGLSVTNSSTSLNRTVTLPIRNRFTTKPPAPCHQPQGVEYLTLDLDQPVDVVRSSPGAVHRSQNSTIEYIEIDPCRTKALSETKRQLETNRHNSKTCH